MKDKVLIVKVDEEFTDKVDYIQRINGYKSRSDAVRKTVEKEYRKETTAMCCLCENYINEHCEDGYVATLHDVLHDCDAFIKKREKEDE